MTGLAVPRLLLHIELFTRCDDQDSFTIHKINQVHIGHCLVGASTRLN